MNYSEIGPIVDTPGEYDDEGNQTVAPTYKQGWHVNTLEPVPGWEAHRIPTPETPERIYAGGIMPVCYKFPDRETFRSLLPDSEDLE